MGPIVPVLYFCIIPTVPQEDIDGTSKEFGSAKFGDKRLTERLSKFIRRIFQSPDKSIHAACRGAAEMMGAYRLLRHPSLNVEEILQPHRQGAKQRAVDCARVYFVQDTSDLDYTRKCHMRGRGRLSADYAQGFYLDCGYLINDCGVPMGIERCNIYAREQEKQMHGRALTPQKESYRWYAGYEQSCSLVKNMPEHEVVYMADRECDIIELYSLWAAKKKEKVK